MLTCGIYVKYHYKSCYYLYKSVSLSRMTRILHVEIGLSFSIYNVFTGSNRSPFFDLQCYYRVKSVSLFRFTMLLQGQMSLPFLIYKVITGSNWSLFFDLHGFYRVKSVSLFRFSVFLQGEISLPFSIFSVFTVWNDSFSFLFTGILHDIYLVVVNYPIWFTCYLQNFVTIFTVYLRDLAFRTFTFYWIVSIFYMFCS